MRSPAWANVDYPVIAYHNQRATWETNDLYGYGKNYGLDGDSHPGVDVSMPLDTPLFAIRAGAVESIRNIDIPGAMEVRILDDKRHLHLYTHLSGRNVSVKDKVRQGELIGWSGISASPHLHFEHRIPDNSTISKWRIIDPTHLLVSGGTPVAYKAHTWPGLDKPVYLPDWIKVEIKLIHHPRFTSHNKVSGHKWTTWHDTGNPRTHARGEWTWANNGREGAGAGGYNAIFDDKVLLITQPFDEEVWAAGKTAGNVGNLTSYAAEQAWGTGVDFNKSLQIGAAFHGGLLAAKGWGIDALVQHNYWTGKDCPGQIRKRGLWPEVRAMVEAARVAAINAANGSSPPVPDLPKPINLPAILFGTARGYIKYDPNGVVSKLWLAKGKETGRWPRIEDMIEDGNRKLYLFRDGSVIVGEGAKANYLTTLETVG